MRIDYMKYIGAKHENNIKVNYGTIYLILGERDNNFRILNSELRYEYISKDDFEAPKLMDNGIWAEANNESLRVFKHRVSEILKNEAVSLGLDYVFKYTNNNETHIDILTQTADILDIKVTHISKITREGVI